MKQKNNSKAKIVLGIIIAHNNIIMCYICRIFK